VKNLLARPIAAPEIIFPLAAFSEAKLCIEIRHNIALDFLLALIAREPVDQRHSF
jgi:hypothetical protein